MSKKSTIGALGEEIACKFLENKGFTIIERNYWKPQGEIDIVSKNRGVIHFVEVKTVSWKFVSDSLKERGISPEENMHKNKLERLYRAITIYLIQRGMGETTEWQADAVFVFIDEKRKKSKIEYYEHIALE